MKVKSFHNKLQSLENKMISLALMDSKGARILNPVLKMELESTIKNNKLKNFNEERLRLKSEIKLITRKTIYNKYFRKIMHTDMSDSDKINGTLSVPT